MIYYKIVIITSITSIINGIVKSNDLTFYNSILIAYITTLIIYATLLKK
ncbi:hypothetical protein [Brachyspira pilosicoli]|nr:hypothetical protein [Brachyspira pilosicoli]